MKRDTQTFCKIGEALFGGYWQTALANELGVSDRSVRRWAAGEPIPEGIWSKLGATCSTRAELLRSWARQIDDGAPQPRPMRFEVGQYYRTKSLPHKFAEISQTEDDGRRGWMQMLQRDGSQLGAGDWAHYPQIANAWELLPRRVREMKDGSSWYVEFVEPSGVTRQMGSFTTMRDAEKWLLSQP